MSTTDIITVIISATAVIIATIGVIYQRKELKQNEKEYSANIALQTQAFEQKEKEIQSMLEIQQKALEMQIREFEIKMNTPEKVIMNWVDQLGSPLSLLTDDVSSEPGTPYVAGVPIRRPELFYGRRELLQEVKNCTHGQMNSLALLGFRKAGKTSFFRFIESAFQEEQSPHIVPVFLDCQTSLISQRGFFAYLLRETARVLSKRSGNLPQLNDIPHEIDFDLLENFLAKASECGFCFLFLLDEFERLASHPDDFDEKFFGNLRHLIHIGNGQLSWITASYRPVYLPKKGVKTNESPFGNIFSTSYVGALSPIDAQRLVSEPAARAGHPFDVEEVDAILKVAGRMPFLLQKASYMLYQAHLHQAVGETALNSIMTTFPYEIKGYFDTLYTHLEPEEAQLLQKIAAGESFETSSATLRELENYGLIDNTGSQYRVMGKAFNDYLSSIRKQQV